MDSDEAINVAITQLDELIGANNETHAPFTLALLMMRADLEQGLKANNHFEQSSAFYFGHINQIVQPDQSRVFS